ncbi:MAG: hypothetical protein GY894_00050 [Planctomycetes bacterium]|nr:hypothetical protein [Planctomycetota bacterium]
MNDFRLRTLSRFSLAFGLALAFNAAATSLMAETLYVNDEFIDDPAEPDDMMGSCENAQYSSIQEAIVDAASGDTIMLCDCVDGGDEEVYLEEPDEDAVITIPADITSLTIKSVFGPDNVILSGESTMPLVRLEGEDQTLTLVGLTLAGGQPKGIELDQPPDGELNAYVGGGILILKGEVDLQGCIVQNNTSFFSPEDYGWGGGAYVGKGASLVVQNYVPTLFDLWNDPAGVYPTIFTANSAIRGGAVYAEPTAQVTLIAAEINANVALLLGGGIYASEGSIVEMIGGTLCGNYQPENAMAAMPEIPILSKNIWGRVDRNQSYPGCVAVDCDSPTECIWLDPDVDPVNVITVNAGESIQAAINAAGQNHTKIEVWPGTYLETINLEGKAILIEARDPDPGATVIEAPSNANWDANNDGQFDNEWPAWKWDASVVTMTSGEKEETILRGLTITNGLGAEFFVDAINGIDSPEPYAGVTGGVGGGILCGNAFPRIEDCYIHDNFASGLGGGVFSGAGSEPSVLNTITCGNQPGNFFGPIISEGGTCESLTCVDDDGNGIPDTCDLHVPPIVTPMDPDLDSALLQVALDAAIDVAHHGDVIEFPSGTYAVTINPLGKALLFRGAGPTETILDGGDSQTVITCREGETNDTRFEDLSISSGRGSRGGGVALTASSPAFSNVTFSSNVAESRGGAVYMSDGAKPLFDNCRFDQNTANWGGGAAYALKRSAPIFSNCTFTDNETGQMGGAVAAVCKESSYPVGIPNPYPYGVGGSLLTFFNCSFATNSSARYGGAVWSGFACEPWFDNCTFQNNVAEWSGGGVYVQSMSEYSDASDSFTFGPHPGYPDELIGYPVFADLDDDGVGASSFACNEPKSIWGDASAWWDPYMEIVPFNDDTECLYCNPDVNRDMRVDYHDLIRVVGEWGNCEDDPFGDPLPVLCDEDVNGDYVVEVLDLLEVLIHYGKECPVE